MASFFQGLLLFLFGILIGAGGVLFFTPGFTVVFDRSEIGIKPVQFTAKVSEPPVENTPPAVNTTASGTPKVNPFTQEVKPNTNIATTSEPVLNLEAVSRHLNVWPNAVLIKVATTVEVFSDGKKVQDLALETGAVLQLSKVRADGMLEVRAKGTKFEIKNSLTDFASEVAKRVAELESKGTRFDTPLVTYVDVPKSQTTTPASTPNSVPEVVPAPVAPGEPSAAAGFVAPIRPMTLQDRVDILFGRKSAPVTSSEVTPESAASQSPTNSKNKEAEKAKDLDNKIHSLFK